MLIIGCDFHTRYQQIAMMDTDTGELVEQRLEHENGEAHAFYRSLSKPVRVGIEALAALLPGQYVIYNKETGQRLSFTAGVEG